MPNFPFLRNTVQGNISGAVGKRIGETLVDSIEIDAVGLIRLTGWTLTAPVPGLVPRILLDQTPIALLQTYRLARPDVAQPVSGDSGLPPGIVFEYLVPEEITGQTFSVLSVLAEDSVVHKVSGPFYFQPGIHYRPLIHTPELVHRHQIYGSGLPNAVVHPEALALARLLPGPVLDFGCGSGALIRELRGGGTEAFGIELDSKVIRDSLQPDVAPNITLYDGHLPTAFRAGQFRSVFCSEVLEHIPEYRDAAAEIARLTAERAIFTVPDASAIPMGFRHGLVPWHLMEGTHFNFFSQSSLHELLRPLFRQVTFGRVGSSHINETTYHVSLVAYCWK